MRISREQRKVLANYSLSKEPYYSRAHHGDYKEEEWNMIRAASLIDDETGMLAMKEIATWKKIKAVNQQYDSYSLKHLLTDILESRYGGNRYLTNGRFKALMILSGFYPWNKLELNHEYRLSNRSVHNEYKLLVA